MTNELTIELRLGNKVYQFAEDGTFAMADVISIAEESVNGLPVARIRAIDIDTWWLDQFGFKKGHHLNNHYYRLGGPFVEHMTYKQLERGAEVYYYIGRRKVRLYFVHQLQNIHFNIYQSEL